MLSKLVIFLSVFAFGEIIINLTWFPYIKNYFPNIPQEETTQEKQKEKKFLFLDISISKGLLERMVLYLGLTLGISQILIVFGAIKIGSRFDKSAKVLNDYFIIGNFSSILIAIFYWYCYNKCILISFR
jgi:hypothetical protein